MDILSRQRRSKVGISPQFRFAIQFVAGYEDDEIRTVEILARTKKKAANYFRRYYPDKHVKVLRVYSPKERKRYAPKLQKTFATTEAKRITNEIFGSNESSAQSIQ